MHTLLNLPGTRAPALASPLFARLFARLFVPLVAGLGAAMTAGTAAAQTAPLANWTFSEAAGTTLNLTANSGTGLAGSGSTWDVAMAGLATDGSGLLAVRNSGGGGSGTRTTYADFGPAFAAATSGVINAYATIARWNFTGAPAAGPRLTLALIEGNSFSSAEFTLAAGTTGLVLNGGSDPTGNGSAFLQSSTLPVSSTQAFTVRLQLDLGTRRYDLALDSGSGFNTIGSASADSFTAGVNALRLSLSGDFTLGAQATRGLWLDRVWVDQGVSVVPEPSAAALWLAGVLAVGGLARQRLGG